MLTSFVVGSPSIMPKLLRSAVAATSFIFALHAIAQTSESPCSVGYSGLGAGFSLQIGTSTHAFSGNALAIGNGTEGLLLGWAVGIVWGSWTAWSNGLKPLASIDLGGVSYVFYVGLGALILNIVVAAVATVVVGLISPRAVATARS